MKKIPININASRVLDAISKIGYTAHTAIMDLIDNSVTAGATNIEVQIERIEGTTLADKNNAKLYRIIDNGKGMNSSEIIKALELGSIQEYGTNSLSKYGMGLKSAGLSLGTKIQVISKQNNDYSISYILDKEAVKFDLEIFEYELSDKEKIQIDKLIESPNGTIIEITGCENVNNRSIQTTIKHLEKNLGVVYYEFLMDNNDFSIFIQEGVNKIKIEPLDILFLNETITFNKEKYDCTVPCKVFDEEFPLPIIKDGENDICNAKLQVVIFPQSRMAQYPGFNDSTKNKIKKYMINQKNNGFYIYRNNRLIRWADKLETSPDDRSPFIVPHRAWGFRAKLKITSELDETLHVDVSKQRLLIPDEILAQIKSKIRPAMDLHDMIFNMCTELYNSGGEEGEAFNEIAEEFSAEDPDIDRRMKISDDKKERQKKLVEKSKMLNEKNNIDDKSKFTEDKIFKKVRYSPYVKYDLFWEAGWDPDYGDYIIINQNHTFYQDVI